MRKTSTKLRTRSLKGALAEWRKAHPDSSDDESEESSDDDVDLQEKRKKKMSAYWKNF